MYLGSQKCRTAESIGLEFTLYPCALSRSTKELGLKPENLTPEGGAAVAQQLAKKLSHKAWWRDHA